MTDPEESNLGVDRRMMDTAILGGFGLAVIFFVILLVETTVLFFPERP